MLTGAGGQPGDPNTWSRDTFHDRVGQGATRTVLGTLLFQRMSGEGSVSRWQGGGTGPALRSLQPKPVCDPMRVLPGTTPFPSGISFPVAPGLAAVLRGCAKPRGVSPCVFLSEQHLLPPPASTGAAGSGSCCWEQRVYCQEAFEVHPAAGDSMTLPRAVPQAGRGAGSGVELGEDAGGAAFLLHSLLLQKQTSTRCRAQQDRGQLPAELLLPEPLCSFPKGKSFPGGCCPW